MNSLNKDIAAVFIEEHRIQERIREIAGKIDEDYTGKVPVVIGILKGGFLFMSDLVRAISLPLEMDFMAISSYGAGTSSSGIVNIRKDIDVDITDREVIVVEDIVDSGLSMQYIMDYIWGHKPAGLRTCVLLDKPDAHKIDIKIDYVGFEISNEFVVGYGLDYAELYRNLPYIGILKEECYS